MSRESVATVYSVLQVIRGATELIELLSNDDMTSEEIERRVVAMRASLTSTLSAWYRASSNRD